MNKPEFAPYPMLDPPPDQIHRMANAAVDLMAEYLRSIRDRRLYPRTSSREIRAQLDRSLPDEASDFVTAISPNLFRKAGLDPVKDALAGLNVLGLHEGPAVLHARVRPGPELLTAERYREVPCLVVDYRGEDFEVHTWVQQGTGLVLRQQGKVGGDDWDILRQ